MPPMTMPPRTAWMGLAPTPEEAGAADDGRGHRQQHVAVGGLDDVGGEEHLPGGEEDAGDPGGQGGQDKAPGPDRGQADPGSPRRLRVATDGVPVTAERRASTSPTTRPWCAAHGRGRADRRRQRAPAGGRPAYGVQGLRLPFTSALAPRPPSPPPRRPAPPPHLAASTRPHPPPARSRIAGGGRLPRPRPRNGTDLARRRSAWPHRRKPAGWGGPRSGPAGAAPGPGRPGRIR